MKAAITLYTSVILSFTISISACKKYLDKKSNSSYVTPQTLKDLQGLLDDGDVTMNKSLTPSLGEASSDDYFLLKSVFDARTTSEKNIYTWVPTPYYWANDWSKAYTAIYVANYCLEQLEEIPITTQNTAEWNNVKGSALFYRAYNFLMLIWNYGKAFDENNSNTDLGIVLRLQSDFNVPSFRSSVSECYDRIIDDAKNSIPLLPDIPLHDFRPSKAAAYGLLARTYLSMGRYAEALENSELLLSIENDLLDFNTDITATANRPFDPFNKEIIFYTEMNSFNNQLIARGLIDTILYTKYSSDDIRRTAYFRAMSGYQRFKGSYAGSSMFTGIATDEMYLIAAECFARNGNKDSALSRLNTLLSNRLKSDKFIPVTAATAQETLTLVLEERRKELIFRGLRWNDIKRLNKEGGNIVLRRSVGADSYALEPNVNYFALPLPNDIIEFSVSQNPYP